MSDRIDPSRILRQLSYEHPVFTREAVAAQARQAEINGADRAYFCGAYWGFGFHEDGVVSALNALEHFQQVENAQRPLYRSA
jgi:predicted NAD/FAD-binding protein